MGMLSYVHQYKRHEYLKTDTAFFMVPSYFSTQSKGGFEKHKFPQKSTRSYEKFNQLVKVGVILIPFPTNSSFRRPIICSHTQWETVACPHKLGSRYHEGHKIPEVKPIPLGRGRQGSLGNGLWPELHHC
ncbi:hypothetical protein CEXT_31731 [Caerostris extrusa]|uniref:Uncharacterized protein n=1 Tax=Caerostris extrusa TaxID=172846 RepID=A0AAV4Q435_CAEEX|nr:hypothetical protein CEXT_31731 [Caerostris extrusa]